MTDEQWLEIARGHVERHLGDVVDSEDPDSIYEEALILAHDALLDGGCENPKAMELATTIALSFANP